MKSQKGCLVIAAILLLLLLIAGGLMILFTPGTAKSGGGEKPVLQVLQPQPNTPVYAYVSLPVQATASGQKASILWLRFYVDDLLAGEQQGNGLQLIGTWSWIPLSAGQHTLAFVARNEQGQENIVTLPLIVLPTADRDADTVTDNQDACPDQAGAALRQGCPIANDADNDGLNDDQDACPQEAGLPDLRGCQPWNQPDQDGDGVADWADHCPGAIGWPEQNGCPQEAWLQDGDADGVSDIADSCPQQAGPAENGGCPLPQESDQDGDSIPNGQDACADQPGSPLNSGCPLSQDRDGDGIPDEQDQCPDSAGWSGFNGCLPAGWNVDTDGDGVLNFLDRCDNEQGPAENLGCPMPDDNDGDGVPNDQDNCRDRYGPAHRQGCPAERNLPVVVERTCRFPWLCSYPDAEQSTNVNQMPACPGDQDCDGITDDADDCPSQFGIFGLPGNDLLRGCPGDANGNGQADEVDSDSDGLPDTWDACPTQIGAEDNGGCPWPHGEEVELEIHLYGFYTPQPYDNFYCYARLQNWPWWMRLPEDGPLPRAGNVYRVEEKISINLVGDEALQIEMFCEGQTDASASIQGLGYIRRELGSQFWHGGVLDIWSDTAGFLAELYIRTRR